jgi:hypothetical protein
MIACVSFAVISTTSPAWSRDDDLAAQLETLRAMVDAQARQLAAQKEALDRQGRLLEQQSAELRALKAASPEPPEALATFRGRGADPQAGAAPSSAPPPTQTAQAGAAPSQPVGEAPPPSSSQAAVAAVTPALPQSLGVLTQPGHLVIEPQFEYLHASTNELVFQGVQIVPGLEVGLIDASTAERNTLSAAFDTRFGVTRRAEIEIRVPWVYRHDTVQTLSQQANQVTETQTLADAEIGDVEVTGRYQLNSGRGGAPIWIAAVDIKTNTGLGPYSVPYDQYGVAQKLATGSGFWAVEPSLSVLYPTDPVVLFASLGYIENLAADVDRHVTSQLYVGRVNPGGSPVAAIGFAFALNDHFSFSLGYKEEFVLRTGTELNRTWQYSSDINIGVSTFGLSYRLGPHLTLSDNFEYGVTRDAPDVNILTRLSFYY